MIIADHIYDQFLERYTAGVADLRAGDPFDSATTLAPLSSQSAADELKDKIRQAVGHGATATEVGPKVPNRGAFVQPTILTNIADDNPACYWEFFGPVSMLFRTKDEDDAVRIANDPSFGLGGSVVTSSPKHGAEVAWKISTGMVFVNHPTMVKADLPFGGIRHSGYGVDINAAFSPGTPPSATIHAVPVFIWGMSDYTNHVRKPSRVQRDCHSPR